MKVLKVVAITLMVFFLSLSLVAFGLVFTVKMTALNADFVTSRLDALDVSSLAEEIISEQIDKEDFPEEFTEELRLALVDTIDRLEPVVKEEAGASIHSTYDYLLGKKQSPELALTLRNTFLNSEFVASFLDEIDISSLAEAYLSGEAIQEELPEEFTEELRVALVDTIDRLEPVIKEQASTVADPIFDCILGMSQSLDLEFLLSDTVLNSDFIDSLLEELDLPSLLGEGDLFSLALDFISQQSNKEIDDELEYLVDCYFDEFIIELEPWIKEQASTVADPVFDYLLGKSQGFSVEISLEPVRETLGNNLRQAFLESPPAELAGLSQTELEQYFDEHFGKVIEEMSSTFELDESILGTEVPAEIAEALADIKAELEQGRQDIAQSLGEAETALEESREYIGYFNLGYNLLVVFILLLIAGIVLIYREVKGATRTLGSIFLTFGVINLIAVLVARALIKPPLAQLDAPESLREWATQSVSSSLTPLLILAIISIIVGIALFVGYFIYRRRRMPVETGVPL
jgi:hypothetical protein